MATLTAKDQAIIKRARAHGIVAPEIAYIEWKRISKKPSGLDFALICAFLWQETRGGANVFGHDPTIYVGAGKVTKAKYLAYRALRNRLHEFQGVGGMQLTWGGYQDQADKLGGCWLPQWNYRVAFGIIASHIREYGLNAGIAAYNGSGPAAVAYSQSVRAIRASWEHLLTVEKPKLEAVEFEAEPWTSDDFAAFDRMSEALSQRQLELPGYLPH